MIFGNIVVDIYYIQKEHDKAVDFYEKALRETTVKGVIRLSQALRRTILDKSCAAVIFFDSKCERL
jgi:hypothetical protein